MGDHVAPVCVHIYICCGLGDTGFDSRQRQGIFISYKTSRPALGFTQSTQCLLPPGIKVAKAWRYNKVHKVPPLRMVQSRMCGGHGHIHSQKIKKNLSIHKNVKDRLSPLTLQVNELYKNEQDISLTKLNASNKVLSPFYWCWLNQLTKNSPPSVQKQN